MARRRFGNDDDAPKVKLSRESFREGLKMFEFIRPYRWSFILGLVIIFLSSLTFMLFLYLPGEMVDIMQNKSKHGWQMNDIKIMLFALFVMQGVMSYARVMLFAKVSENGLADLRLALYRKMMSLPISFFEQSRVGELVSRVTADTEKLYNTFSLYGAKIGFDNDLHLPRDCDWGDIFWQIH
jgi:ATP-binding cassette, subfamily B, bacterial